MSTLLTPLAGGIFEWINQKASAGETALQSVAVVFVLGFVFVIAAKGGFTLAKIIMAALAAMVFLVIIFNIRFFQGQMATEVTTTGGIISLPIQALPGFHH